MKFFIKYSIVLMIFNFSFINNSLSDLSQSGMSLDETKGMFTNGKLLWRNHILKLRKEGKMVK